MDVVGRRSAFVGYEHQGLEAWVYPLKLMADLRLGFRVEGYPLEIAGSDVLARIAAAPEATTFTYAHSVFTVRQITFAPLDEPALVILLDVHSLLPLDAMVSFRPRLRLMWPAGLQTGNVGWNAQQGVYELTEETGRFAGVIGAPGAREGSLMPYQEEPRDVPVQFMIPGTSAGAVDTLIPIVIAGSVTGVAEARATYARVLASIPDLLRRNAEHYRHLLDDTLQVETPDPRLNAAFRWAKVGIDKGLVNNPLLGTGLIAGFRTSGDSERPGFAWFFGRDAIWTTYATTAYGETATTKTALAFLRQFQREDGKIPHEISQSASLIPWFTTFGYPWASADATPLFIAGHAEYWRTTGDDAFIKDAWPSLVKAYRFSAATDTDGNGLIENTKVGHGWVEGGALYPPHEEIYLQGVWVAALDGLAELGRRVMHDDQLAAELSDRARRTRESIESVYWLPSENAYAYATKQPRTDRMVAEPGPARARRQQRLDGIASERLYNERTVLTAVPMWWNVLAPDRADLELDSIGGGALATDWGHRILANTSELYDPLSYHSGSVWPLFTGWAGVAAYRYGRPQIGYQALMANALLTDSNALGYITELLSGDVQSPFGRSSHHQVWSEAMMINPLVRGLCGLEVSDGGRRIIFAPQLPAGWPWLVLRNVAGAVDLALTRRPGSLTVRVTPRRDGSVSPGTTLVVAPAFPRDARILHVTINGRAVAAAAEQRGDVQSAKVTLPLAAQLVDLVFTVSEGTDVERDVLAAPAGATNRGLRILRSRADAQGLSLRLEGLGGARYLIWLHTPRRIGVLPAGVRALSAAEAKRLADAARAASCCTTLPAAPVPAGGTPLEVVFEGSAGAYVRRDVTIPLR